MQMIEARNSKDYEEEMAHVSGYGEVEEKKLSPAEEDLPS